MTEPTQSHAAESSKRCADCGEPFTNGVCQTMQCGYQWQRVVPDQPQNAASRPFKLSARVGLAAREAALQRAWKLIDEDHLGYVHPSRGPFEYQPNVCPGCARSIIRAMAEGTLE